jgi:hypothetical protein
MAFGRRKEVINYLITQLSEIDGNTSPFDSSYTFNINLSNKVFRGLKFFDEIDAWPAIYVHGLEELREYHTHELVNAALPMMIVCYEKSGSPQEDLEKLIQDVEHVVNHLPLISPDNGITDILIDEILLDDGLLHPFGMCEIYLTVFYQLEK